MARVRLARAARGRESPNVAVLRSTRFSVRLRLASRNAAESHPGVVQNSARAGGHLSTGLDKRTPRRSRVQTRAGTSAVKSGTTALDEPGACRRSRASRSLPPGEATPRRLPPGEATPRCLPARTCSRALASGRKRARGARRRLLASSHDAGRTGAPLLLAIGRAMADTPVKCRIHVSAGIPRSRLVARRAAGCAGRGCGACWWSCTGATGVRSQRRTRA